MKKLFFPFFLFCLLSQSVGAAIIYVNSAATGLNNGTSWTNAYTDLETATLYAMSGDEIWIAKGTYYTSASSNRNSSFVINNGVKLYGNFAGNETSINQRTNLIPDASGTHRLNETILSGDIGIPNDSTDNANHVIYATGNTLPIIIDGVKIMGGNAILTTGKGKGAGIFLENVGAVTISNVIVFKNTASAGLEGKGAGIFCETSTSFTLNYATIIRNYLIDDASVSGSSNYSGGGIYINSATVQIENAIIENNKIQSSRSNMNGGGLFITNNASFYISNSSISKNLINSTFNSGSKYIYGGGLYYSGNSASLASLTHSLLNQNKITITRGYTYGGSSYFLADTLKINETSFDQNQITNNTSVSGVSNQGIGVYAAVTKKTRIYNTTFNKNNITARYANGGGIYLTSSSADTAIIQSCEFSNNILSSSGYFDGTTTGGGLVLGILVKIDSTIINSNNISVSSQALSNSAATSSAYGAGISNSKYMKIRYCTIDSNMLESSQLFDYYTMSNPNITARAYGGGVYSTAKLDISNSDISYNLISASISAVQLWTSYFKGSCYGGGVYNDFTTSGQKSLITNCTINGNEASMYIGLANGEVKGGGVFAKNMDMFQNVISNNKTHVDIAVSGGSNQGGGVFHYGTGRFYLNQLWGNRASASTSYQSGGYTSNTWGGGLYSNSADSISNCLFHHNSVVARNKSYGGGMYNAGASKITNITVVNNRSFSQLGTNLGSGVFTKNSSAQFANAIIYFNDALNYNDSTTTSVVKNSVIQSYQSGGGNFNIDPLFADTLNYNYHVSASSIAVNRGDSTYVPRLVRYDLDGFDRVSGANIDMGVFEIDLCRNSSTLHDTICLGSSYLFNGQNETAH